MPVETTHIGSLEDLTDDTQTDIGEVEQKVNDHIANEQNPHGVSPDQTGAATQSDVDAVSSTVDAVSSDLDSHVSDGSNPHGVSSSQTGAQSDINSHVSASNPHNVGLSDASAVDTTVEVPNGGRFVVVDSNGNDLLFMTDNSGSGFYTRHSAEISGELSLTSGGKNNNGYVGFAGGDVWLTADSFNNDLEIHNSEGESSTHP